MGHQEDIVKTESKIIVIRDKQVILDRDVAELYGVTTKEVNQALRNNPTKFPFGYVIELTASEKGELVKNFDRFNPLKHSTVLPHAFTEQGLYMLATILKGEVANPNHHHHHRHVYQTSQTSSCHGASQRDDGTRRCSPIYARTEEVPKHDERSIRQQPPY